MTASASPLAHMRRSSPISWQTATRYGPAVLCGPWRQIERVVDEGGNLPHLDICVQACQHPGEHKHLLWLFEKVSVRRGIDLLDPEDHTGMSRCDITAVLPDPPPQITEEIEEHEPRLGVLQGCDLAKKIVTRLRVHQSVELIPKLSGACSRSGHAHGSPRTSYRLPSILSRDQLTLRISRGVHWGVGPAVGTSWGR